mgnify:CR=1 FL=1
MFKPCGSSSKRLPILSGKGPDSKPGNGLSVSKWAISFSPSGNFVSDIPIGNLPVPKMTSTNWPKAANTFVFVTLTKTLDFSDSLNLTLLP